MSSLLKRMKWSAAGMALNAALAVTGIRNDAAEKFRFYVEIEGVIIAHFTSVHGLELERDELMVKEGGVNDHVHRLPGRIIQKNIRLQRGVTYSHELFEWFQEGRHTFGVSKRDITIILGNTQHLTVQHWDVREAWPVRYVGASLDTSSSEIAVEEIELAYSTAKLTPDILTPMSGLLAVVDIATGKIPNNPLM